MIIFLNFEVQIFFCKKKKDNFQRILWCQGNTNGILILGEQKSGRPIASRRWNLKLQYQAQAFYFKKRLPVGFISKLRKLVLSLSTPIVATMTSGNGSSRGESHPVLGPWLRSTLIGPFMKRAQKLYKSNEKVLNSHGRYIHIDQLYNKRQ